MPSKVDGAAKLRVLLVDDHSVVRKGLSAMLSDAGDIDVVAEAPDAVSAMAVVRAQPLDVVLSDIAMPGRNGLELLKMIKAERPKLPVLMLSMYAEEVFAVRALKLGAAGYLMKDVDPQTLFEAIRKVANGGKYISLGVADRLAAQLGGDGDGALHERLSERELEVFRLIASGKSLTEIAEGLHVSIKTISSYRTRILEKTGFTSNADFTRYALDHHLID